MENPLLKYLNKIAPLSEATQSALESVISVKNYPKKAFLVQDGKVNATMYFIQQGCVREFYISTEGVEHSTWFGFENDIVVNLRSFFTQQPSEKAIQTIENSIIYQIAHKDIYTLYDAYPDFERVGRILAEQYLIQLDVAIQLIQTPNAFVRYENLIKNHPNVLQRIPLTMIASYLGVTLETLSRIRNKKSQ